MALGHSPAITTNGLIYYHDVNNIKSYAGPSIQNMMTGITPVGTGTATGYSSVGGSELVNIPQLGLTTTYYNYIQNNYQTYTPNSNNCCPSLFQYANGIAVTPSTLYTYGLVYKCDSGYTGPNYMYRYEYASNGGAYVTEGGVHSDSNRTYLGNGWWWAWGTFTTNASTNWLGYMAAFYYQYSSNIDKMSVAKVLLTPGNYTAIHPKFWPAVNTTRANTAILYDLTGNNTVTANSLTYTNDSNFSFNGTSNSLTIPFNSSAFTFNNEQTIIIWMKDSSPSSARRNPYDQAYGGGGTITHESDTNFNYYFGTSGINNTPYSGITSAFTVVVGETAMICLTRNTSTISWYKNGAFSNSIVNPYGVLTTGVNNITLGSGYAGAFGGNLYAVQVYNRCLTATEVLQNFNALRGRFNL